MTIETVRFYVGDTATPYLLTDEQIELAIDATTSDLAAAALCARSLSARFAREVDKRFETIQSSNSQKSGAFEMLARNLEQQAKRAGGLGVPLAGGISIAEMESANADEDRVRPFFRDNWSNNPPAPNAAGSGYEE
jgi:hypothetical protein